jgi:hypothetical protein
MISGLHGVTKAIGLPSFRNFAASQAACDRRHFSAGSFFPKSRNRVAENRL